MIVTSKTPFFLDLALPASNRATRNKNSTANEPTDQPTLVVILLCGGGLPRQARKKTNSARKKQKERESESRVCLGVTSDDSGRQNLLNLYFFHEEKFFVVA